MSRARDVASLLNTVATDTELNNAISAVPTSSKNLLYNGAMQVAQRGTSSGVGVGIDGYYTADRWRCATNSMGLYTQTLENDAPNGSGFRKSFKLLCSTADASPAAGDYTVVEHRLEGQDLQGIAKGTSNAKQLTMSFWVKSNVTGTYTVNLWDLDNARLVAAAYTVSASATWEKKTITFPADTVGQFDNDNGLSLRVYFNLGAGTDFTSGTLATNWETYTAANRMVGQTNLAANTNNYWQVTGVQLEVGDTATEFEHLPFGVELARCERYFQLEKYGQTLYSTITNGSGGFTWLFITGQFSVNMRATPSVAINPNSSGIFYIVGGTATDTSSVGRGSALNSGTVNIGAGGGGISSSGYGLLYLGSYPNNIARGEYIKLAGTMMMFSAEL